MKHNIQRIRTVFSDKHLPFKVIQEGIIFFLRKFKISIRLLTSFILLTILSLSLTGFIAYSNSKSAIDNKISMFTNQVIMLTKDKIEIDMKRIESYAADIASNREVIQANIRKLKSGEGQERFSAEEELKKFLNSRFYSYKGVTLLEIIPDGSENPIYISKATKIRDEKNIIGKLDKNNKDSIWTEMEILPISGNQTNVPIIHILPRSK